MASLKQKLNERHGLNFYLCPSGREYLVARGLRERDFGARPLRREIARISENGMVDGLLEGKFPNGSFIFTY